MTSDEKRPDLFEPVREAAETIDKSAEDDIQGKVVEEIESLCMNCHRNGETNNGTTKLLLTRIPFFKEIILMSFECPTCGYKNTEVEAAGTIQERGCKYKFTVASTEDLSRQVVKSEKCSLSVPKLSLEVPALKGKLSTVEGLLSDVADGLSSEQERRKELDPESWEKIEEFIKKVHDMREGKELPWDLSIDDPSGNSWVEPSADDPKGKLVRSDYIRTKEQNEALGLATDEGRENGDAAADEKEGEEEDDDDYGEIGRDEVYTFPATCPSCNHACDTHMKMVDIPHFKEVVIMSTVCDSCGYKSNEVKTGGAVPSQGRRITLKVTEPDDLARDILKSETCALSVPEVNLDLTPGTLGGRFTTLEGLLKQVYDELKGRIFQESEDSMDPETRNRWTTFFENLKKAVGAEMEFTVILEDPLAASYLQNLYAPDPDPNMTIENYDRTDEQEEDLGLKDMNLEEYKEEEQKNGDGEAKEKESVVTATA